MFRTIKWLCWVFCLGIAGQAAASDTQSFDHSHKVFSEVLSEVVVFKDFQSLVNYKKLKASPEKLDSYVDAIESVSRDAFNRWTEGQQMAFLINAYNALTLKLVISEYPDIESIKDIGGLFFSPWDEEFFTLFGQDSTLNYIEHGLLRVNYEEPRIHFAIVCASIGCPALQRGVFLADKLDEQLDMAAVSFMSDPSKNRFDSKNNIIEISSIFKWFEEDFEKAEGSVEAFVAPWLTDNPKAQKDIELGKVEIRFLDYDWSLNSLHTLM